MKCAIRTHRTYQELLSAFKGRFADLTAEEIDRKADEVWQKSQLKSFEDWYAEGKKDSYGTPELQDGEFYINDKGDKISIFELANSDKFAEDEKTAKTVEELQKEKHKYEEALKKISDILVNKIAILKNSKKGKDQASQLTDLKLELDKLEASEAVVEFALNAIKQIATSKSLLENLINTNKINIKNLSRYKNYVSAYDVLDDILDLIEEYPENFPRVSKSAISEAITQRDFIKRYYLKNSRPELAKALFAFNTNPNLTEQDIENWLANAPFDIDSVNMWTHFMGDSRDPILALGAKMVDDSTQQIRQAHIEFRHKLFEKAKKLENFKGSTRDATKLFEDFLETDLNGKRTGFIISEFRYGEFYKEKQVYLDKIESIEKDKGAGSAEYKEARKEYWKWLRNNVVQEYTKEYFDILESLSQEARDARDVFQLAKKEILKKYQRWGTTGTKNGYTYDFSNIVDNDWDRIKELNKQMSLLKNDYDESGMLKDEKGLRIAKELRNYAEKIGDIYEVVGFNKEGFEKAKKLAYDSGETIYQKWLVRNTSTKFTDEFWDEFNRLLTIITGGVSSYEHEQISKLLAPYKDEDGVVKGHEVPLGIKNKVKELAHDIKLAKRGDAETTKRTAAQIKASKEFKRLVEFVPTPYYDSKYDEMENIGGEEFDKWFKENHTYNRYTKSWEANREWTTMVPKKAEHILDIHPNNNWYLTEVKEKYKNSQYREDNGRPVPVDKWKNNQYNKLLASNPEVLEYYNFYKEAIEEANKMIPYQYRIGYRIPSVRKGDMARVLDGGENAWSVLKESIKDRFVRRKDDTEYGQLLDNDKNPLNYLPVYFTADIEPEERSYDLTALLNLFWGMAMRHEKYSDIIDNMEGIKFQLRNRSVVQTNSAGQKIVSRTKGLNNPEQVRIGVDSKSYKQFEDFMNRFLYGQMNEDLGFWNTGIGKIDRGKVVDNINSFSSYGILGLNILAGTVNMIQGELANQTEAAANLFFGAREYGSSIAEYNSEFINIVNDVGRRVPKSKIGLLNEALDTLGKYSQQALSAEESNAFARNIKSDLVFFMNNVGEHRIQSKIMIAMLKKLVPRDANGNIIEGLPNMYNAFTVKDGKLILDDRVKNFDAVAQRKFSRQMKFVIRRLHGNYDKATSPMWQRNAMLRAIGSMRKWIMPGIQRRYETQRYNEFGETMTEGMYRTTGRILVQYLKGIRNTQANIQKLDWSKLTEMERANIRRTVTEISQFVLLLVASVILGKLADDDRRKGKKNKSLLYTAYLTNRMHQELAFYTGTSALQILRSPATSVTMLENTAKLLNQLIFHPTERYKIGDRKGDLKIGKKIEDLTMYKQFRRTFTYEGLSDQLSWIK